MYNIARFNPKDIAAIKIQNQAKILELTGSKLDLMKAYELIKSETENFTVSNKKAKEADALYAELLKRNGIALTETPSKNLIQLRERERERKLMILEIELQLAA